MTLEQYNALLNYAVVGVVILVAGWIMYQLNLAKKLNG